jgi:hypothetical protein
MIYRNIILILFSVFVILTGCRDREEQLVVRCSTPKAEEALKQAEASLREAGTPLSFTDPGQAMHPEDFLPDPEAIRYPEKQNNFEATIGQLNIALEELDRESQIDTSCSVSDRALLHLHLGLAYIFDAVSRILISDEAPPTFVIKRNSNPSQGEIYTFDVSPEIKAKLDNASSPEEYLSVFTEKERQGIMDFVDLIDDAVLTPTVPNIQPRSSSVNRPPYARYAIWHLQKAVSLFGQYDPEIQKSLNDFNKLVDEMRAKVQEKSESWGFIYTLPPER